MGSMETRESRTDGVGGLRRMGSFSAALASICLIDGRKCAMILRTAWDWDRLDVRIHIIKYQKTEDTSDIQILISIVYFSCYRNTHSRCARDCNSSFPNADQDSMLLSGPVTPVFIQTVPKHPCYAKIPYKTKRRNQEACRSPKLSVL